LSDNIHRPWFAKKAFLHCATLFWLPFCKIAYFCAMITVNNIYVQYGERILLDRVSFTIKEKDRVGLVGRNGAGKSTMLKLLAGDVTPDEGNISRPSNSSIGFLHQEMNIPKGRTVLAEAMTAFDEAKRLEKRLAEIEHELAVRTDYETDAYHDLLQELSDVSERLHLIGGNSMEGDAMKVLKGLGFKDKDMGRLTDEFSGGWQMRIELAKMLLQRPDYLLLDEPTNHLDIESILWLEDFLKTYEGAVVTISHDKTFLDNVTKRTLEIELGKLYEYKAAYSEYMELRKDRREKMEAAYRNQQREIAQRERTINRFMAKATKTKMAQSMQKQLDKVERIELADEDTAAMRIQFPPAPRAGQVVVEAHGLSKHYGQLRVLNNVEFKLDRGDRIAFVGQNGQGKTTLSKIIVGNEPATAGSMELGHNVTIGYYAQNQAETLSPKLTLLETMELHSPPEMRTKLRAILGAFMFSGEDSDKKVLVLSGGERARLALACMLLKPFNLLVLDEPTNHLDMISKDVLKQAVMAYDGTLIVVSHDRDFLKELTTRTLEFRDGQLHNHIGDVNVFLEKRQLENMRQVEMGKAEANAKADAPSPRQDLSDKDKKQLQRAVQQAERKIAELETLIGKLEHMMAKEGFYESRDRDLTLKAHKTAQEELDTAMAQWESAQAAFDAVN
jgi:ATP-binding cassette subfamily F protein 3